MNTATDTAPLKSDTTGVKVSHLTLIILTIVYAFNFIDRQLISILQESIKADLLLSDTQLGLLSGFAFAMFYVTAGIPIARLADRSNRRNIIAASIFVWSFMTCLCGAAANYVQLLLARIGVGVGEAGGSPPSHSIISDIYPANQRATAMGFYSTGVNIGILFGFLLGGWLNEYFGWRVAFVVVGVPGVIMAVVVRYLVREPVRGQMDGLVNADAGAVTMRQVLAQLWSMKTFRYLSLASAFNAFAIYAVSSWSASFFIRSHAMDTGELGSWLALILGLGGAIGVLSGGYLSDRFSSRSARSYMLVPAIALALGVPVSYVAYSTESIALALVCLAVPGVTMNCYLGNVIATTHRLVYPAMRATASAILFLILNILGLGAGPSSVGIVSDYLEPTYGVASLGMALSVIVPVAILFSAILFFLASKHIVSDQNRMERSGSTQE